MKPNFMQRSLVTGLAVMAFAVAGIAFAADDERELETQAGHTERVATNNGSTVVRDKIAGDFKTFAGSEDNAKALVMGLRDGTAIMLTSGGASTTFTPATGKMGWGNVFIALALTQEELKNAGVTAPTIQQLQSTLQGVLALRASGMGWGRIANEAGFKLGPVVARIRSGNEQLDKVAAKVDRTRSTPGASDTGQPDRPARGSKPERPDRPERPGKS